MDDSLTPQNVELSDIHDRPELITSLLYKKMLEKLDAAIMLLPQRRYLEANQALQHCNEILTRLGFGIKYEAGVLADQLELLYKYLFDRICEANLKKDIDILREVRRLVRILDDAWATAMERAAQDKEQRGNTNTSNAAQASESVASTTAPLSPPVRKPTVRMNPYQQREMEHEVYHYEMEKQEVHLKK